MISPHKTARTYVHCITYLSLVIAFFLLISFSTSISLFAEEKQARKIVIAHITDLTGKGANLFGIASAAGAELARSAAKSDVRIVLADSKSDSTTAVTEISRIIASESPDIVLSDLTQVSTAISKIVERANKVMIYQSPSEFVVNSNPLSLRHFFSYRDGCQAVARDIKKYSTVNVASIAANSEFGELCTEGVSAIYPQQVVERFDSGAELRSLITRIKARQIPHLFFTGFEPDVMALFQQLRELKYTPRVVMPSLYFTPLVKSSFAELLEGTLSFGFPQVPESFRKRLLQSRPDLSEIALEPAVVSYINVRESIRAILECGGSADPKCILRQLEATPPDAELGFAGWKDRRAAFDMRTMVWRQGRPVPLGTPVLKME